MPAASSAQYAFGDASPDEVETGAYAVAAPITNAHPVTSLATMSHTEPQLLDSADVLVTAAEETGWAAVTGA